MTEAIATEDFVADVLRRIRDGEHVSKADKKRAYKVAKESVTPEPASESPEHRDRGWVDGVYMDFLLELTTQYFADSLRSLPVAVQIRQRTDYGKPILVTWVLFEDGSFGPKSLISAIDGPRSQRFTSEAEKMRVFRKEIAEQIMQFKREAFARGSVVCSVSGKSVELSTCEVDHYAPSFKEAVQRFLVEERFVLSAVVLKGDRKLGGGLWFADRAFAERWKNFHCKSCCLRILETTVHRRITATCTKKRSSLASAHGKIEGRQRKMGLPKEAEEAREELAVVMTDLEEDLKELEAFEIADQEDMEFAVAELKTFKANRISYENKQKSLTSPLLKVVEEIRELFRPPIAFYKRGESMIKEKMVEAHKKAEQAQQAALEEAGRASMQGDKVATQVALRRAGETELTPIKGVSMRDIWDYEIEDFDLLFEAVASGKVSRDVLTVDHDFVMSIIKQKKGNTKIPGLKVFAKQSVAARAK